MTYTPQLNDLRHTFADVSGFNALVAEGLFPDLDMELVDAVLEEAGKFAAEIIAPINQPGDTEGCTYDPDTGNVTTATGWKDTYAQWVEAGWGALPCSAEHGGQGLPTTVALAVQELWNTAANAYGIGTLLTQGAVNAIIAHGSEEVKAVYLPKMVTGEWSGTMNLTEPQAGSDLAALRTKAEPQGDGTYKITGTKIYITHGEHDLTENIIHLVLARLPDAPEGTRGISLFVVPKFLVNADGSPGERNDVKCAGLEEKMGIHGSPTAVMKYGEQTGAIGWLLGEENRGLACMFTMMNHARLNVGMQGVAIAERAFQHALAYALERRQGRRPGSDGMVPIVEHPDVRRMLMDMKTKTAAARAICYASANALDRAEFGKSDDVREQGELEAALLTPVAKTFGTEMGVDVASIGIQVFGGMGFIEETGAAQHLRYARITPIYEGTNGIQAIDLATRKLPLENGDTVRGLIDSFKEIADAVMASNDERFGRTGYRLTSAVEELEEATAWMLDTLPENLDKVLASATPYSKLMGLTAGGCWLAKGALAASQRQDAGTADADGVRILEARYFAENHLPQARGISSVVRGSADAFFATTPDAIAL
ncbi:MAG: acyl-CoA dehydrogenase [Pseudomonadota bacterium]